jgi:YesN/AraC family two-component response regulator
MAPPGARSPAEVAGEWSTAAETIEWVLATHPDVVFPDIRMPDGWL